MPFSFMKTITFFLILGSALFASRMEAVAASARADVSQNMRHIAVRMESVLLERFPDETPFPIAVISFETKNVMNPSHVEGMVVDLLIHHLTESPSFRVLERLKMSDLVSEIDLGFQGYVDEKTAAQIGKMRGARFVLLGNIYGVQDDYQVNARLVNVETSVVAASVSRDLNISLFDSMSLEERMRRKKKFSVGIALISAMPSNYQVNDLSPSRFDRNTPGLTGYPGNEGIVFSPSSSENSEMSKMVEVLMTWKRRWRLAIGFGKDLHTVEGRVGLTVDGPTSDEFKYTVENRRTWRVLFGHVWMLRPNIDLTVSGGFLLSKYQLKQAGSGGVSFFEDNGIDDRFLSGRISLESGGKTNETITLPLASVGTNWNIFHRFHLGIQITQVLQEKKIDEFVINRFGSDRSNVGGVFTREFVTFKENLNFKVESKPQIEAKISIQF